MTNATYLSGCVFPVISFIFRVLSVFTFTFLSFSFSSFGSFFSCYLSPFFVTSFPFILYVYLLVCLSWTLCLVTAEACQFYYSQQIVICFFFIDSFDSVTLMISILYLWEVSYCNVLYAVVDFYLDFLLFVLKRVLLLYNYKIA